MNNFLLFQPKGLIASGQRDLMILALILMLVAVVPVFPMMVIIAWKYRASKQDAKYTPNWDSEHWVQALRLALPLGVILVMAVITWQYAHDLDPRKSIASANPPITIQVVALEWKWLFIYPEQDIATVNFVEFPQNTPVHFVLTADAPMNSFWIPQLGGQMYAMAGMSTQLNLIADEAGEYSGSAAEINGKGFAGMRFVAKSTSKVDFENWVAGVQHSSETLDMARYNKLAEPSENNQRALYSTVDGDLYNKIIMKFMAPTKTMDMEHMNH